MIERIKQIGYLLESSARDLAPIVIVVAFFQLVVLRQPLPDLDGIIVGLICVVIGLVLFVQGLELALFPLGENMAEGLARKGNLLWLLVFAYALGFGTTVAEPALIAVAEEAGKVASNAEFIEPGEDARRTYAFWLRFTVANAVGLSLVIGVFRILKGWPIHYLIIGGYLIVVALTFLAPPEIVSIAYDSGGVTTSTITVPLVTALGVGLSTMIRGRNPLTDGFGLIAFASLLPVVFVLIYGMVI
jgi:hypothetical protein